MADELAPPRKSVELEDPGAKELVDSDNEHFSDASEGRVLEKGLNKHLDQTRADATSPIPITRVERVDDEPAHGEVPGTAAYNMRTQDAVPDEVEIVPDGQRSRSASRVSASDRPLTPGGTPVPKMVVERIDPDQPAHGEVPGTLAYDQRRADAAPDIIVKAPEPPKRDNLGSPTTSIDRSLNDDDDDNDNDDDDNDDNNNNDNNTINTTTTNTTDTNTTDTNTTDTTTTNDKHVDDDGFGDFDDFEDGAGDDDFGDFDDGFQQGEEQAETTFDSPQNQTPVPAPPPGPPVLDYAQLSSLDAIIEATQPYVDALYSNPQHLLTISTNQDTPSIFHSERSHSLWTQLVAPPPLQPPDWVRSRIRRLFLVSLGVPVDLDEILPASKQKKLVLPSIHIPGDKSPRPSSDGRNTALDRVKRENASNTSVDSSRSRSERPRKGPPPPPDLDLSATSMLCATTEAALRNFTDAELLLHVDTLTGLRTTAELVFAYWQKQLESALGDKDAFEQVIESLVAHAKKLR